MTAFLLHIFTRNNTGNRYSRPNQALRARIYLLLLIGMVSLAGCNWLSSQSPISATQRTQTWEVYANPRYGFEFVYPGNWQPQPPPSNLDGRRFSDPQVDGVEIAGWASSVLLPDDRNADASEDVGINAPDPNVKNFVTDQGVVGHLDVEIGVDTSSMTLILIDNQLAYYWQGQAPSSRFAEYYRLFDYVARQYRIPLKE